MIGAFVNEARNGLRLEGGGHRRDHLRAFQFVLCWLVITTIPNWP
jgi:hypothetical protein